MHANQVSKLTQTTITAYFIKKMKTTQESHHSAIKYSVQIQGGPQRCQVAASLQTVIPKTAALLGPGAVSSLRLGPNVENAN